MRDAGCGEVGRRMAGQVRECKAGDRIGNYTVLRVLAKGNLGAVYLAEHYLLKRQVGLKMLLPGKADDAALRELFLKEAVVTATFQHPNVVAIHDIGEYEGGPYYTMDIIEGRTLSSRTESGPSLPTVQLLEVFGRIADALLAVHDQGYVHRCVHPGTITVRSSGEPVLLDFGLAATPAEIEQGTAIPAGGHLCHTAPELLRDPPRADGRADIFSLGATMFTVLAGRTIVQSDDRDAVVTETLKSTPFDLSPLASRVPDAVTAIVAKCIEKDPDRRYRNAGDLRKALEAAADHLKVTESDGAVAAPKAGQVLLLNVEQSSETATDVLQQYEVRKYIGSGQFGDVYHARDVAGDRDVALKILNQQWVADTDATTRFRREAALMARLSHPNVVNVFDFGRYGQTLFIAMELLVGSTLQAIMRLAGRMSPGQAASYMMPVFEGLAAVHEAGAIHRDVKPSNVMLAGGRLVICDFGIARADDTLTVTMSGAFIGTPAYASPEQVRGEKLTTGSDVFSGGVMLYEMLCGKRPFKEAIPDRLRGEPAVPVTEHRADLPAEITDLLSRALDGDPSARPAAHEVAAALVPFAAMDDPTIVQDRAKPGANQ